MSGSEVGLLGGRRGRAHCPRSTVRGQTFRSNRDMLFWRAVVAGGELANDLGPRAVRSATEGRWCGIAWNHLWPCLYKWHYI